MARSWWIRSARLAIKTVLAGLVLWYVGRHVARTWKALHEPGAALRIEPAWFVAGGVLYLAGLSACAVFYGKVLASSSSPVPLGPSWRAYLISHLGKYVPGKAMVVVMRVGLVVPYGARPSTAALATFYETLVMMAAGALAAAIGFALGPRPLALAPLALSLGLGAIFLLVVHPRVFPRISSLATLPFPNVGPDALPFLSSRLLTTGLLWSLLGWILLGMSQVAVARAVVPSGVRPELWPLVIASVALATVAGFVVAVTPGGLGVREGVLMSTLTPALGTNRAVFAALALRLTWVVTEVVAAALLALVRFPTAGPGGSTSVPATGAAQR
ncbi:MAG: hypothetical protein NVSMB9_36510 [Isosphaeraceae bacterium]